MYESTFKEFWKHVPYTATLVSGASALYKNRVLFGVSTNFRHRAILYVVKKKSNGIIGALNQDLDIFSDSRERVVFGTRVTSIIVYFSSIQMLLIPLLLRHVHRIACCPPP